MAPQPKRSASTPAISEKTLPTIVSIIGGNDSAHDEGWQAQRSTEHLVNLLKAAGADVSTESFHSSSGNARVASKKNALSWPTRHKHTPSSPSASTLISRSGSL